MTAGTKDLNNGSDVYDKSVGISGSHAYSLIDLYEIEQVGYKQYRVLGYDESRQGKRIIRLLKIRNPWGQNEWKGDWGDHSYKWTEELK